MIEIEDYKPDKSGKSTIATFTAHLVNAKMRIRKCKLLRLKTGHLKVALPSYSETPFAERNPNDPLVFKQYIEFTPEKQLDFQDKAIEAISAQGLMVPAPIAPEPFDTPF